MQIAINSFSIPIFDAAGRVISRNARLPGARNVQSPRAHNARSAAMAKLAPTVEQIEIFGDLACSFEDYMTSVLHPLAGVSLHTARGPLRGQPPTSPFPPAEPTSEDVDDDEDDPDTDDDPVAWSLKSGPATVKFSKRKKTAARR